LCAPIAFSAWATNFAAALESRENAGIPVSSRSEKQRSLKTAKILSKFVTLKRTRCSSDVANFIKSKRQVGRK
jgi:hypothetical protein